MDRKHYDLFEKKLRAFDRAAVKFMILALLFFAAVSPVFRQDRISNIVGILGVTGLAVLASKQLFGRVK
jgi:hypothetical protein